MSAQELKLKAIADAIREKDGTTAPISAADFPARIRALTGGGVPAGTYTITLSASNEAGGTVSGGGVASAGMMLTVQAEVAEGYEFSGWRENGKTVSTDSKYTFEVTADRTLVGTFEVKEISRLPAEYQEVEYVDFDGTTRINNAINGEFTYFGFELEIELLPTSVEGTIAGQYAYYQFKSGTTTYNRYSSYSVRLYGENIIVDAYYSNKGVGYSVDPRNCILPKQNGKMKIAWDLQSKTFSINSNSGTYDPTFEYSTKTTVRPPQIGCRSNGTSSDVPYDKYTAFRFYSMKTFYLSGTSSDVPTKDDLYNYLVPCYRKSDNLVGLYDIQRNIFHSPATGALIAGPSV